MNQFMKAMMPYRDSYGFPSGSLSPHDPSGNCLMFLGEEILILHDQGLLTSEDKIRFEKLLSLCELEYGNFRRAPSGPFVQDQEQWDDYIGISIASAVLRTAHAAHIIYFGQTHFFRWKWFKFPFAYPTIDVAPLETGVVNEWFGRNLSFIAHIYWCFGIKPKWWLRFAWCWAVAFAGWSDGKGQDPWRLSYLLARAPGFAGLKMSWWQLETWAVRLWAWRLHRNWPGGIPAVRAAYFRDPVHPLATWMREAV